MMAENILEVYELTKMYNHFTALDHICLLYTSKFHFPSLTRPGLISDRVIANVYRPIIKAVFNDDITQQDIKDALADWEKLQRWLYDPKGLSLIHI